jgi:hypothetical protein
MSFSCVYAQETNRAPIAGPTPNLLGPFFPDELILVQRTYLRGAPKIFGPRAAAPPAPLGPGLGSGLGGGGGPRRRGGEPRRRKGAW